MKRRIFLRNMGLASLAPFALNAMSACGSKPKSQKKVFVFIQLIGGNDGLNTLIPLDNYSKIVSARPNLYIPENKILSLSGTSQVGLHPALSGIQDLYNNGLASFVQGVGYENPSYSHFRSSDIYLTGSRAEEVIHTGWMARYLETKYKNYPTGYPNPNATDPPAIKIGDTGTYLFQGQSMDLSIVIDPLTDFAPPEVAEDDSEGTGLAEQEVKVIREMLLQTQRYSKVVNASLNTPFNHSSLYPEKGKNPLADQLKMVAKLIHGGLNTSVYLVDLKGFDTHDDQVTSTDTTKGVHADLLAKVSEAITCFWADVNTMGREQDIAGMTFSEFGRRIKSNGSFSTDHGSSQPILFFGAGLNNTITGDNPTIPDKPTTDDNLSVQYDFRNVYATVLSDWFGANKDITKSIFNKDFDRLPVFESSFLT